MSLYAKDASLTANCTLPNGTAAATYSTGMNLGLTVRGETLQDAEFEISAPALSTSQLPDTKTMTYAVVVATNSTPSNPTLVYDSVLVQTGASGAGAAASTARFRLPLSPGGIGNSNSFVSVRATNSGTGNASGATSTLSMYF